MTAACPASALAKTMPPVLSSTEPQLQSELRQPNLLLEMLRRRWVNRRIPLPLVSPKPRLLPLQRQSPSQRRKILPVPSLLRQVPRDYRPILRLQKRVQARRTG